MSVIAFQRRPVEVDFAQRHLRANAGRRAKVHSHVLEQHIVKSRLLDQDLMTSGDKVEKHEKTVDGAFHGLGNARCLIAGGHGSVWENRSAGDRPPSLPVDRCLERIAPRAAETH
jgi:hypothetical protein